MLYDDSGNCWMPCRGFSVALLEESSADARWRPKMVARQEVVRASLMLIRQRGRKLHIYMLGRKTALWLSAFEAL
jgi:hypothetical protein